MKLWRRLVCLFRGHDHHHYVCCGCASIHEWGCSGGLCGKPFCGRCLSRLNERCEMCE